MRKKRLSVREFLDLYSLDGILEMAEEYISGPHITTKFLQDKYNISGETFRKLIDMGFVECVLPKKLCLEMEVKSISSQKRHHPESTSSQRRFKRLWEERELFIAQFDDEILELTYTLSQYDSYWFEEEGQVEKAALERRLEQLETRRFMLENY